MATTTVPTSGRAKRPSAYEAPYTWDGTQSSSDQILGWMRNSIAEGETFLQGQTGYQFVPASYRLMMDKGLTELPPTLSQVSMNFVKRDIRELIGILANPRPLAGFKCENSQLARQGDVLNKLYMSWYMEQFVDRRIREALQFTGVEGTGYLMTGWDPNYWYSGKGDITLTPLGVDDVLVVGCSPNGWDLQKAYAVIIRRQLPTVDVIRAYPTKANMITPDGESSTGVWRRIANAISATVRATVHNTYGRDRGYRDIDPTARAVTTVYDIYINDATINMSNQPMVMGVVGSPWEYRVPFYGQELPTGIADPATGAPLTRKADYRDARIYPYRRHIVCTNRAVLSDGPNQYWHGEVPLVKFRLDDWPFEYCGIPLTKEPAKLQAAVASLLRAKDDSNNARLRPPIMIDTNRIAGATGRSIDPRIGGQTFEVNDLLGEAVKVAVDPSYYTLDQDTLALIQFMRQQGKELIGLPDLQNLQEASQIPAGDNVEKLAELAGPLATDMTRNMEASLRALGEQFKALAFEFYTARRRFSLLGPDGLTREDFDYDPGFLIPNDLNLPGTLPGSTRAERGRAHMQNFQFSVVPGSMYGQTQSSRKMLLIQLARMGFPISPYTVLEACDVPNPGTAPVGAVTEIDKFWAYKENEAQRMTELQAAAQAQMMQINPAGAIASMAQQAVGGQGNPGPGRKPSGQVPPHQEVKDGGTRTTIAES